ncbi:MAG: hypothetical protein HQM09_08530 [Candidatus Riflebacteria bacterium]|nr:hypothetical protein [Candidatus Riflebacteria bacterium]
METFKAALNLAVGLILGAAALKGARTLWKFVEIDDISTDQADEARETGNDNTK